VGEWRRGKWIRWISATQKIDPESGEIVGLGTAKSLLNDSAQQHRSGLSNANIENIAHHPGGQQDSSYFGNNVESMIQDIGYDSRCQTNNNNMKGNNYNANV